MKLRYVIIGVRMKIRDKLKGIRFRPPGRVEPQRAIQVSLDPVFSYERDGHRWSFEEGRILVDGYDVGPVISEEETTVSTLIGLASGLDEYKRIVEISPQAPRAGRLVALADALVEKILGKIKKVYDDKIFGVSWQLKGGDLIINGVNINSFLALYRVRKTEKARRFLKGLRGKIDTLLANPSGSLRNEKARLILLKLQRDIDEELDKESSAALAHNLLHSGDPHG